MRTLFLDLDNTLIYSHRHPMAAPKRVAEIWKGREQSYISQQTFDFLAGNPELRIVPVTTRTQEQYRRLEELMGELGCRDALICNGAVLLHGTEIDSDWSEESRKLAGPALPQVERAEDWLRKRCGEDAVHSAMGFFVYAKAENGEALASALRQQADGEWLEVLCDHGKVFCLPRVLNKGTALMRFAERYEVTHAIAAGDSAFDIPMLERAELAIAPAALRESLHNPHASLVQAGECWSDELCAALYEILGKQSYLTGSGETEWNNP